MSHTINRLPYLGKHKPAARRATSSPILEISMSDLSHYESEQVQAKLTPNTDPYTVLINKVEHLADLLGCTEREAEMLLFARL